MIGSVLQAPPNSVQLLALFLLSMPSSAYVSCISASGRVNQPSCCSATANTAGIAGIPAGQLANSSDAAIVISGPLI